MIKAMRFLPIFLLFLCLNAHAIRFVPLSGGAGAATSPQWQQFIVTSALFTAGATSEDILLVNLAADSVIHGVQIKHTAAFVGGGATTYEVSVGLAGDFERFASDFQVANAPSDTNHQDSMGLDSPDTGSLIPVRIRAISDVNLNTLASGTVRVRLLVSNP